MTFDSKKIADVLNDLRIMPRMVVFGYAWMMWDVSQWFMKLPAPLGSQAAFIATMIGAASVVFGFYVNSGSK
ncbi:MAG: hypothetical protein AB2797_13745 [Candidatus Thiodiazotropha sp.]